MVRYALQLSLAPCQRSGRGSRTFLHFSMAIRTRLLTSALLVAASGIAGAQSDDCANPTPISGLGSFAFDTFSATTSGFDGGGACIGGDNITFDVFFVWTAPSTRDYVFDTEGSTYDTQLSVHSGSNCGAICDDHDDDGGTGLLSEIELLGVNAGDTFVFQIGGFPYTNPAIPQQGTGFLNIDILIDPCSASPDDTLEENDTCTAPATLTTGFYSDLFVSITDPDFYQINVPVGFTLDVQAMDAISLPGDVDLRLYDPSCNLIDDLNADALTYNVGSAGGNYVVEIYADPTSADTCTDYDLDVTLTPDPCFLAMDDALEENDDCGQEVNLTSGSYTGLFVSKIDWDYYTVNVASGDTLQVDMFFLHADGDTDIFLYEMGSCADFASGNVGTTGSLVSGFSANDNEQIVWTNTTGQTQTYIIKINVFPLTLTGDCNTYDILVSGADGQGPTIGDTYCDNVINTTGQPGLLAATGSAVAADNNFTLTGTQLPDGEFCFFLASRTQGFIANPNSSQGNLCVLGNIARFNFPGQFGQTANGMFSFQIPLDNVPEPPALSTAVVAGDTWNFQLWYRDFLPTGPTSNFTQGLEVLFQ